MRSTLRPEDLTDLLTTLDSRFVAEFANGAVLLLGRDLDGAVCALVPDLGDGVLRIVYDPNQPNALLHVQTMMAQWWESYAEPVAFPDGTVELIRPPCPRPAPGPPVEFARRD